MHISGQDRSLTCWLCMVTVISVRWWGQNTWLLSIVGCILSLRSDGVPFAGDSLERSYLFYDRPSRLSSNAPACRGQSRLSGFCCALGHRASTFHACAHLITTAVRYQLRAQGRYFVPEPNMVGGVTGRSPGERPHDGIAGESPA